MLNATGAFSHIPAYRSMLSEDHSSGFSSHSDCLMAFVEDSLRAEMAQSHFYQSYIQKWATGGRQNCTQGPPCRHAARALPEGRRLLSRNPLKAVKADPKRLVWRPPFTTDGSQGEGFLLLYKR